MTRSERIHQAQRAKRKVANYCTAGDKSSRAIGMAAHTPCLCSCWMCGNPSRYEGDKVKYKALFQRRLFEGWNS
jgi:hypothetical protein